MRSFARFLSFLCVGVGFSAQANPVGEQAPTATVETPVLAAVGVEKSAPDKGPKGLTGKIAGSLRLGARGVSPFPLDDADRVLSASPLDTRLRVAPELQYGNWTMLGEFDTASGSFTGLPSGDLTNNRTPLPRFTPLELRQLYVEYKGETWLTRVGQMATPWGLGLLANNGARDAQPGDFGESRLGDLTYRALVAGRPFYSLGGAFRAIEPVLAAELIARDDFAVLSEGDRALQGIAALRFNVDADRNVGAYVVVRQQRGLGVTDGARATDVVVFDVAGKWKWQSGENEWGAGFEVVSINGTSTLARSDTAPVQDVRQFGGAFKTSYKRGRWKGLLDGGYASGDQNPYDAVQEGFRFDPDYRVGLVLFDQVLGWQSARSAARAADPALVGVAPDGVNLLPTRGSVTGAWYVFPRANYSVRPWLDVYGGPLLAFSTATLTDPFTTRVGGGTPLNSLGGTAGRFLGTEWDLGLQAKFKPNPALLVNATAEGGLFLPGDAFATPTGTVMGPVATGRIRLWIEL